MSTGDAIELIAPAGPQCFRIAGVYLDYTRDQGVILMDRANYSTHWPAPGAHTTGLHLHDPAQGDTLGAELRERFGARPNTPSIPTPPCANASSKSSTKPSP